MSVTIKCPTCSTELEGDNSLLGNSVTCPKCGNAFTAQAASPTPMLRIRESAPARVSSMDQEETLFDGGPEFIYFLFGIILSVLLCVVVVGIFGLIGIFIAYKCTHYTVTSQRVIVKSGFLNRRQTEIWIKDMRGVDLKRNLWDLIVGTGSIAIGTAASAGAEIQIYGLRNAQDLVDKVNQLRRMQS